MLCVYVSVDEGITRYIHQSVRTAPVHCRMTHVHPFNNHIQTDFNYNRTDDCTLTRVIFGSLFDERVYNYLVSRDLIVIVRRESIELYCFGSVSKHL